MLPEPADLKAILDRADPRVAEFLRMLLREGVLDVQRLRWVLNQWTQHQQPLNDVGRLASWLMKARLISPDALTRLGASGTGTNRQSGSGNRDLVSREAVGEGSGAIHGESAEDVGPYRVIRELGRGGMGVVLLATHKQTDQVVALKLIPVGSRGSRVARFKREIKTASKLDHPNIVRIYDHGMAGRFLYYAMERLDGMPMDEWLEQPGLSIEARLRVVRDVARGLEKAHDQNVVHRDIKPANIFVLPDGSAKITDFGLAKDIDSTQLTRTGQMLGTPYYMSPEQAMGEAKRAGPLADQFAVGVILYEVLAGQRPFDGKTPTQLFDAIQNKTPTSIRQLNPEVPAQAEEICGRALEKIPSLRFPNCGAFADALDALLEGRSERFGASRIQRILHTVGWKKWVLVTVGLLTLVGGGIAIGLALGGGGNGAGRTAAGKESEAASPAEEEESASPDEGDSESTSKAEPSLPAVWHSALLERPTAGDLEAGFEPFRERLFGYGELPAVSAILWSRQMALMPEPKFSVGLQNIIFKSRNVVVIVGAKKLSRDNILHEFFRDWARTEALEALIRTERLAAGKTEVQKTVEEMFKQRVDRPGLEGDTTFARFIYAMARCGKRFDLLKRWVDEGNMDDSEALFLIASLCAYSTRRPAEKETIEGLLQKLETDLPTYPYFEDREGGQDRIFTFLSMGRRVLAWVHHGVETDFARLIGKEDAPYVDALYASILGSPEERRDRPPPAKLLDAAIQGYLPIHSAREGDRVLPIFRRRAIVELCRRLVEAEDALRRSELEISLEQAREGLRRELEAEPSLRPVDLPLIKYIEAHLRASGS